MTDVMDDTISSRTSAHASVLVRSESGTVTPNSTGDMKGMTVR